jgi:molybdopterin-guanine dinucleotide biosynthesis protein A
VSSSPWYAVVIAGGSSRRFGTDKLTTLLQGATVLDRAVADLPRDWQIFVVGPPREVGRAVTFVSEEPAGSGPGAALVAGARAVLARGADRMVCLPGDAPAGGQAAVALAAALTDGRTAVVAVDAAGRQQPLQIAVRGPALASLAAHAPQDVVGCRARALVDQLNPYPVALSDALTADIDTPADAENWLRSHQAN